jgi:tRNA-specific 2-thiouridylase
MLHGPAGSTLLRGRDPRKDQSYFLWGLPRALLPRLHFPLGELTKPQVRERARELGLVTADKPESQEICFVPTGDYRDLLERRLPERHRALEPGPIVDEGGRPLGEHGGYAGFTVGQRKGLGGGFAEALFVLEIRPETREVVVGPAEALDSAAVEVGGLNWLADAPEPGEAVAVQVRYRAAAVPATVVHAGASPPDPAPDGTLRLVFRDAQRAVTPGQSAVVFRGDRVLGGGRIVRALREAASRA